MDDAGAMTQRRKVRYPPFWRKKVALLGYLRDFHLAPSVEELFTSLAVLLRQEFGAIWVRFSLLNIRKAQHYYHEPQQIRGLAVHEAGGLGAQAIDSTQAQLSPDGKGVARLADVPSSTAIRSSLAAPLQRDGRVLGTVELLNRTDATEFTPADAEYLEALAPHMAISLNHFILSEEAHRRRQEERHLNLIVRSINSTFNLSEILEKILESVQVLLPYDVAAIILFPAADANRKTLVFGQKLEDGERVAKAADQIFCCWVELGAKADPFFRDRLYQLADAIDPPGKSKLAVSLESGNRISGVFVLSSALDGAYSKADYDLLESFANQVSLAIERARSHVALIEKSQLEQELRIARDIQLRFQPRQMPSIKGFEIAARNVASRGVSGDYYDFIPIVPGQWGVVIGDVAGKGISAGLIMSAFRASLLAEIRNNFSISKILSKVNRLLWETTDSNRFVTAFYGVLDEQLRVLTYVNAGHNPPLVLNDLGQCTRLASGGLVLGAFENAEYTEERLVLAPGELFLLYTDGLTESRGADGEELGTDGLENLLRRLYPRSPEEIAEELAVQVTRYSERESPEDDATLVIIKASSAS